MALIDDQQDGLLDVVSLLDAIPYCMELFDRVGLPCRVWRNPTSAKFGEALETGSHRTAGLRALITVNDLYVWQSVSFLHAGFVQQTGIDGVRVRLGGNVVSLNQETVAFPEHFPWIFCEIDVAPRLDLDDRRKIAIQWLHENRRLRNIYESSFAVEWYS